MEEILRSHGLAAWDLAIALIFLLISLLFAKRGFYKSAVPIAAAALSLFIGVVVSDMYSPGLAEIILKKIKQNPGKAGDALAKFLGIDINALPSSLSAAGGAERAAFSAAKESLSALIHIILLITLIVFSYIIISFIARLFRGAAELPLIRSLDKLGGLALGIAFCIVMSIVIVRIADLLGFDFFRKHAAGTVILNWLINFKTPLRPL